MRIISGTARGRRLKTLEGMDVRPTTEKVKEAIFSSIQFDLPQATVLDLFAGSGQLGLEALSRGANRHDTIQEMLLLLEHHVAPDGKIICEHERELELPEELGVWRKKKTYSYGSIAVTVYIYKEEVTQN